ncbi:MAG: endonuclease/exonuclease/phosphatase family protein [Elainella sp. Prado103]|jgi:endonuclease/exonuclease/phosphatase family metal-dependent hydrolase|nr:endonuclease/exonuclease/phosphatase family protein [Elainella sp. Prado103]
MSRRTFRVGTFNLCNLALPNQVFYKREVYTPEEYARKISWVAGQLDQLQADLIGFQEVFHAEALQQALQQSQTCQDLHLVVGKPIEDTPAVALASRFPILSHRFIRAFPAAARLEVQGAEIPLTHFSRPILSARLRLTDRIECTVFVVHLKSKRPIVPDHLDRHDPIEKAKGQARSLILRAAESIALRVLLMEVLRDRDHPVIVLGDMNDGGAAVTSQLISGEPPHRKLETEHKRKIWDVLLYHVKDIQARQSFSDVYYTHIHNGRYESLDHIMVSQEFVTQNPDRIGRVVYVSVLNDHLIDETLSSEDIPKWQSDHAQVVASIDLERPPSRPTPSRKMKVSVQSRREVRSNHRAEQYAEETVIQIEEQVGSDDRTTKDKG